MASILPQKSSPRADETTIGGNRNQYLPTILYANRHTMCHATGIYLMGYCYVYAEFSTVYYYCMFMLFS